MECRSELDVSPCSQPLKETTLRSPIDSWYEEIHYLRKENGRWRIVSNMGGESVPVLQFGVAPHPLF
jgi:hypothetical protein